MKKQAYRWLTIRFTIVVLMLGLVALSAYLTMQQGINAGKDSGILIKITGQQRLLSQKIALLISNYYLAQHADKVNLRNNLSDAVKQMEDLHRSLTTGNSGLNLPGTLSDDVRSLYFGPADSIDQKVKDYLAYTRGLLEDADLADNQGIEHSRNMEAMNGVLLNSFNNLIQQYQLESETRTDILQLKLIIITALALFLLGLCWLAVFQPIVSRLRLEDGRRREMEEKLRHAQRLEAVGQLTGGVAHDFNNILGIILGNLELLKSRIAGDAQAEHYLENALQGVQRGATLTQRLLTFSRKQMLEPEALDLNKLIQEMDELLRRTLMESIEIETVCAAGLWSCVADKSELENVLLNLVINSRDAMPGGGKLTIETTNTRLSEAYCAEHDEVYAGQYVMLAVSDTGTGMSKEVQEHAFDPFYTTKAVGKGSGLGLSMAYGFCKQSRGTCNIYSEEGKGTTVKIYLPRHSGSEKGKQPVKAKANVNGNNETVLLVEDEPALLEIIELQLHSLGYQVLSAKDGNTALEVFNKNKGIDLLLTDVVLPGGMSGRNIAEAIEKQKPDIKIIYMSGYTENAIIHHGRLDDSATLLRKPFDIADLAGKLREALGSD